MIDNCAQLSERVAVEYKPRIYGYIIGRGVPFCDRDDVFSDILLKATAQAHRYDEARSGLSTWVYIICRSVVTDYYRKRKTEQPLTESMASEFVLDECVEYEMELCRLAQELRRLTDRERKIIVLRLRQDMKFAEIARDLNLSETNARVIYSRAIQKLREWMAYAE